MAIKYVIATSAEIGEYWVKQRGLGKVAIITRPEQLRGMRGGKEAEWLVIEGAEFMYPLKSTEFSNTVNDYWCHVHPTLEKTHKEQ